jgi:hypothetical protein
LPLALRQRGAGPKSFDMMEQKFFGSFLKKEPLASTISGLPSTRLHCNKYYKIVLNPS